MNSNSMLLPEVTNKAKAWTKEPFDSTTRAEVKQMIEQDHDALIEAFYKDLEFGTGGLRGIMGPGTNRVNKYTIGMATQGLSNYILANFTTVSELKVAIAYDSRNNSRFFAETTADVFSANGIKVYLFESLRPTPELSFAIRELGCHSGVVITASHNPKEYNGYKVYWADGGQVISPHDKNIIAEVGKISSLTDVKLDGNADLIEEIGQDMDKKYLEALQTLSLNSEAIKTQADLKIVYTPIHGSGVELVPKALKAFGFKAIYQVDEQDKSDGNFPTVVSPNPEEKAALNMAIDKAKEVGAELVMATDPDADRVGIAVRKEDGEYLLLNGNQTGSLLVYYVLSQMKENATLQDNQYVAKTIVTTPLFSEIAHAHGIKTYEVLTGFKYIADLIETKQGKEEFLVGGEESYGYLAGEFVRDKDAVMSCALIAELTAWAKGQGMSLLDLLDKMYVDYGLFKEHLISIVRKGKSGAEEIASMMERLRNQPPQSLAGSDVTMMLDFEKRQSIDMLSDLRYDITLPKSNVLQFVTQDGSIVSIRPSGTEPKIKFYFSTRQKVHSPEELEQAHQLLSDRIQQLITEIGAE